MEVRDPQEAYHGLGWAIGDKCIVFNGNYGCIMGRHTIWVKGVLMTLERMFEWVGLYMDLGKTNVMTCTPSFILGQLIKDTHNWRATG